MMNTQLPILNAVSSSNAGPAPVQAESARAGASFNQILNKEVSNRKSETSSSESNTATAKNNSTATSTSTQPQTNTQNQAKPAEPTHANAQETAKPNENASAVKDTKDSKESKNASSVHKKGEEQAQQDDEQENSNAASAQILALVSNVGQLNNHQNSNGGQGQRQTGEHIQSLNGESKTGKKHSDAIGLVTGAGLGAAAGATLAAGIGSLEAQSKLGGLKAQDEGVGQGKPFSLNDQQEKSLSTKQGLGAAGSSSLSLHGDTEKNLAEGAFGAKAAFSLAQDKDQQANGQHAKAAVDANARVGDANMQPNSLALAPGVQQSMSLNQQGAIAGQPTERLTPAVGSPGWDQAVGQKVVWMASGGLQSASLTLNPPDLGPLQVVLHVHNDQADATFITAQPEVKQALEAAMPKLREMLDASGIQLSQATVNTGLPNQQQGNNRQEFASGRGGASGFGGNSDEGELNVATIPVRPATGGLGIVDTFA